MVAGLFSELLPGDTGMGRGEGPLHKLPSGGR